MRFLDFWNEEPGVDEVFLAGVGFPSGFSLYADASDDLGEDVSTWIGDEFWDLEGTVEDGRWEWDGGDSVSDLKGNTVYKIVLLRKGT